MVIKINTFKDRLRSQLLLRGMKYGSTNLAREFNLRWQGKPITTNAARKWLYGQAVPRSEKIQVLAKMLGTSSDWLLGGGDVNITDLETQKIHTSLKSNLLEKQLLVSLLNDWSLLNQANKQLICAISDFLVKHQNYSRHQ